MLRVILSLSVFCSIVLTAFSSFSADDKSLLDGAKITIGLPLYVAHTDSRANNEKWNDGVLQNAGIFGDISWPIHQINSYTDVRAGFTAGIFDNSIFRTSVFAGGMAEIDTQPLDKISFKAGGYFGSITGYESAVLQPAIAPYLGVAYQMNNKTEIGLRELWLPAKTLSGSNIAGADALVTTVTIGYRF